MPRLSLLGQMPKLVSSSKNDILPKIIIKQMKIWIDLTRTTSIINIGIKYHNYETEKHLYCQTEKELPVFFFMQWWTVDSQRDDTDGASVWTTTRSDGSGKYFQNLEE